MTKTFVVYFVWCNQLVISIITSNRLFIQLCLNIIVKKIEKVVLKTGFSQNNNALKLQQTENPLISEKYLSKRSLINIPVYHVKSYYFIKNITVNSDNNNI